MKQPEYYASSITITSKKIFNRLAEFNIIPRKTYSYSFPKQLINHPLLHHFIRGCIDGDGWIRKHCSNGCAIPNEIRVGLCGTETFMKETFDIIKNKLQLEGASIGIKGDKNVTWQFEFNKLHDVDHLVDWLYKDATVFLERKYSIAKLAKGFAERYTPFVISKEQLEQDYKKYCSIKQLSKKYGIDSETVKRRLVDLGVEHNTLTHHIYITTVSLRVTMKRKQNIIGQDF